MLCTWLLVSQAVERFKTAGRNKPEVPPEGFGVGPRTLVHLLQDREYETLQKLGGVRPFVSSST
jgi:hypothetical protein